MARTVKVLSFLLILLLPLLASAQRYEKTQYMTITASRDGAKTVARIEPFNDLRLNRFTMILWTNNADVPVRLRLGQGTPCQELSDARLRVLDWRLEKSCFVTQKPIPPKGVLETNFNDEGKFPYVAELVGTDATVSGTILIYGAR